MNKNATQDPYQAMSAKPSLREIRNFVRNDIPSNLLERPRFGLLCLYTLQDWLVILISALAMTKLPAIYYPVFALIIGGRIHSLGIITHDLCHARFRKSLAMRLLEMFSGYWVGNTAEAMGYHHLRHHRHTFLDTDPYLKINKKCGSLGKFWLSFKKGIFLIPFWISRSFAGVFAYFIPSFRTFYARIFLQDISRTDLSSNQEVIQCAKEDIPLAFFHAALIALTFKFPLLIFAYYIPIEVTGVLCIYRLLIEHEYEITNERSLYSILDCTADHHLSIWGSLFFAPRNVGYHAIHHIHPQVGMHTLPKIRRWYAENCSHYQEHMH